MNAFVALLLGLTVTGIVLALVRVNNLLGTMALLSALSGFIVLIFALLGAVDVAFMEAVVGVGVSTMFLMTLLGRVDPDREFRAKPLSRVWGGIVACTFGAALVYGVSLLPTFGDPLSPASKHIARDYVAGAMRDMETPNVVTAVLADYRGFDTLIETAVVLTAAMACVLVLGRRP
jgi:multicomponent Na+:H+ antiporter subunit B